MMAFMQIMELTTSNIAEVQKLTDEWLEATKGKRTTQKLVLAKERGSANTYVSIVEFASYEEAVKTSNLPKTQEISAKMMAACDSEPKFRNLDVIQEDYL